MRRLLGLGIATALGVAFAVVGAANAAPLGWNGTMTIRLGTLPNLVIGEEPQCSPANPDPSKCELQGFLGQEQCAPKLPVPTPAPKCDTVMVSTGGGVADINGPIPGHLETLAFTEGRNIAGTDTIDITDPGDSQGGALPRIRLEPAAAGSGMIGPISGVFASAAGLNQKVLPIGGVAKICLLSTVCTDFLPLMLTQPTPGGVKGFGVGGLITIGQFGAIRISVEAAPWTVKTATAVDQTDNLGFVNVTGMGFAHGPNSGTTSTAAPSGVVQIVTPAQIRTNLSLGSAVKIGVITELLIHFIPEPGLLFLLGSGVVGLAVLGRSRMKS